MPNLWTPTTILRARCAPLLGPQQSMGGGGPLSKTAWPTFELFAQVATSNELFVNTLLVLNKIWQRRRGQSRSRWSDDMSVRMCGVMETSPPIQDHIYSLYCGSPYSWPLPMYVYWHHTTQFNSNRVLALICNAKLKKTNIKNAS